MEVMNSEDNRRFCYCLKKDSASSEDEEKKV